MAQTEKENMNNSCSEQKNDKIQCELLVMTSHDLNMTIAVVGATARQAGRHQKHSARTERQKEIFFGDTKIR